MVTLHNHSKKIFIAITAGPSTQCQQQVKNRCPLSLKIDWWEIPPYIYKDDNGVSGIFPKILKKLVTACCDRDPSQSNDQAEVKECVTLNYTETPSNDSEVVKKQIDKNGMFGVNLIR